LDDKSPLLRYSGDFLANEGNDDLAAWYYHGTYAVSSVAGASMQWTFNGTGFTIWGVLSGNHGPFSVLVDGQTTTLTGYSTTLLYQQPLFSPSALLNQSTHTITLDNLGTGNTSDLDVDMVTFQSDINAGGSSQLVPSIIQDTDDRFQWTSVWDTNPTNVSLFNNGTGHTTTSSAASVTLSFTGKVTVSLRKKTNV